MIAPACAERVYTAVLKSTASVPRLLLLTFLSPHQSWITAVETD
jgi:hypothetical protein